MTDNVDAENAYEQRSQQEMETGEVEIVDSGRVIDELDEALMQMSDAPEESGAGGGGAEQPHDRYVADETDAVPEDGKVLDDDIQQDAEMNMSVSEEVIVETEEGQPAMAPVQGSDVVGDMDECDEGGMYTDDEDESDMYADREVDQIIRDPATGEISLTMDLEDLVSRTITFDNGERIILCFSKRCRPQIAWNGHLYVAASDLNEISYTKWRCVNAGCPGALRTSPGLTELRASGHHHLVTCKADDLRVRLRIIIYDLRLMAEFTDDPLEDLYSHFVDKLAVENPDVLALFPPLDSLVKRLTKHRGYKIYRRRFEYEKIMAERRRGLHSKDYIIRRQRPFPPSVCIECGVSVVTDADTTSQENFVDHVAQDHQREATAQYYSFHGVHLFEQWMRELQQRSRYKIRRFSMHNESLFFLCAADDRWCRAYGVNSDGLHCTAFVRVYDYRRVSRQETRILRIQYCLDHNFHSDDDATVDAPFTPEIFMHELEERRLRTAGIVKSNAQRARLLRRRGEMGSEIMPENDGTWTEESGRMGDPNLQASGAYASGDAKHAHPAAEAQNHDGNGGAPPATEFNEGPDTEHGGQEETAAGASDRDNTNYGIEGSEEGVGQEIQGGQGEAADGAVSKVKRVPLQRPRFMGSRYAQQHGSQQQYGYGRPVKSEYDEKREVAALVEQCNRRVSESCSTRSTEHQGEGSRASGGQPHYITHRSNFSSYTLYNLVMQIELQCELFKERAQSLKHIAAAKKYLKYLTSLCEAIATDSECSKTPEELAAEIFDLKESTLSGGIVVTKQTGNLPVLDFDVNDDAQQQQQQRDGKSEPETQPLIFLPVIPAPPTRRSAPEEMEKPTVDEEEEMDVTEQSETADEQQPTLRRSKRGRGKEEVDTPFEVKKGRGRAAGSATPKAQTPVREPYQTRRSRGVLKPNTKGVFDKKTYVGEGEATSTEADEATKSQESRGPYTLRRIPFSGQTSKVKLAGRTMQLSAEPEEVTGKPMTLKTAAGNLVTVMRRMDGRLIMVSPRVSVSKEPRTPTATEETQRETRSRTAQKLTVGKKTPKQEEQSKEVEENEEEEEEEPKETKVQRTTRASERRSVYSKYLRRDKSRREEKSASSGGTTSGAEKEKEKERETGNGNSDEAESSRSTGAEGVQEEAKTTPKKGTRKQLSENDVIVMDDETFLAVVEGANRESPVERVDEGESRRSRRGKEKVTEESSNIASPRRGDEAKK